MTKINNISKINFKIKRITRFIKIIFKNENYKRIFKNEKFKKTFKSFRQIFKRRKYNIAKFFKYIQNKIFNKKRCFKYLKKLKTQ